MKTTTGGIARFLAAGAAVALSCAAFACADDEAVNACDDVAKTTCVITLNANGGSVTPASLEVEAGESIGELPKAKRSGYDFIGWYTEKTGGEEVGPYDWLYGDITLYAHWQKWYKSKSSAVEAAKKTGKSIFLVCGRNSCGNTMYTKTYSCADPETSAELERKCILWYSNIDTQPNDTLGYRRDLSSFALPMVCLISYKSPSKYVVRSTGPLSAYEIKEMLDNSAPEPTPNLKTVKLVPNGGSVDPASVEIVYGGTVGELPKATRAGYTFKGWFTAKSGGKKVAASTKITKNVTYYAQWTVKKYTVTLKKTGKGKVSGGGKKAYKSKITLKATASKGYKFAGWYDEDGALKSKKASWATKVPLNGATYTAKFVKK